jgi:signal transduction histidine kinase
MIYFTTFFISNLMPQTNIPEHQMEGLIQAIKQLGCGDFDLKPPSSDGDLRQLEQALSDLAEVLRTRTRQSAILTGITAQINAGLLLDDVLVRLYKELRDLLPYNRIGVSLISEDGETVRAVWSKSDLPKVNLGPDFTSQMAGSSLETILKTRQPRIINDLIEYLKLKPESTSTKLIVDEGICSSLTCPLVANGKPIGFIFFSSAEPNTYRNAHVEIYQQLTDQLAVIVERSRMVTELAKQKQAIEDQNQELSELNDLKTTLLGMAAHDLRHPLGYIQLANELLIEELDQSTGIDLNEITDGISKQVRHGLNLLDELLDVTLLESEGFSLDIEEVNLAKFLTEVVEQQSHIATMKDTQIILTECPEGDLLVDPQRLNQVINNLISNAIKYSPPGSTVKVFVERNESYWRINVEDEGPGIKPRDHAHLFQDFAKLSARPTGGEKSTGLGLAIARRVVEAHGGQIGVDSAPGEGATFWFTLPINQS